MSESCIRLDRKEGFSILYNSMVRDPRLSLKTKGLMAVIVSLPDTWKYNVGGLAKINGVGKDTIRGALNELEQAGYLTREQSHGEAGKFGGNIYVIHDVSTKPVDGIEVPLSENPTTDEPSSGKPSSGKPSSENPTLDNKDLSSKDIDTPPKSPKGGRGGKELSREVKDLLNGYVGHDKALADAMVTLMEIRTEHKATNSVRAVKSLLDKLDRLSGGDRRQKLLILEQSNATGKWLSVFPLREGGRGPTPQEEVEPVVI